MPRTHFPNYRDTELGMLYAEVTVLPPISSGEVIVMVDTSDGPHFIVADRERWEAIITAIRASLDEAK